MPPTRASLRSAWDCSAEETRGRAPGVGCTADCNGGRFADCTQLTGVGLFEVSIDNLKLNFAVPSTTTGLGGHCVGDPF